MQHIELLLEKLELQFQQFANSENAHVMQKYMKHVAPFYGIKKPEREKLMHAEFGSTKLTKAEVLYIMDITWHKPQREWQYMGLEILIKNKKTLNENDIFAVESLILSKSWWDTVDLLAANVAGFIIQKNPQLKSTLIPQWTESENLWLNRSAIIHQLHYGTDTDVSILEQTILPFTSSRQFFHAKAIGWALRQYARVNPTYVIDFVHKYPMQPLSKREALKHLK